ncbi:MAG: hypothetical protein RIQ47_1206 [Bacteroidota bacterium]|jgi:hypothetical protein
MSKTVKIVLVVLCLILAGVLYGIREFTRTRESTSEIDAVALFKADSLAQKFEDNDSIATVEFGGKVLQVEGVIEEATSDNGTIRIRLRGSEMSGIMCQFEPGDSTIIKDFKPGATVCLKGQCNAYQKVEMLPGGDLLLSNCVLTDYNKK